MSIIEYVPKEHGDWIYKNDPIIFPGSNLIRYDRSVYTTLRGWIVYKDNKIVGSCLYGVDDDTTMRPYWYFAYLGIHPKYQNKGLGTKLLKKLLDTADFHRANLECFTKNTIALNMYKNAGFNITETGSRISLKRRPAKLRKV